MKKIIEYFEYGLKQDPLKVENLKIVEEIIASKKVDLLDKIVRQKNFDNMIGGNGISDRLFEEKCDFETMVIASECLARLKNYSSYCFHSVKQVKCKLKISKKEKAFYHLLEVVFANEMGYNYFELMEFGLTILEEIWQEISSFNLKVQESQILFNMQIVLFSLMLKDDDLTQKYDIIKNLEDSLSQIIVNSDSNHAYFSHWEQVLSEGPQRLKKFNDFDISKDSFRDIYEVHKSLPSSYARNIIGYTIVNKSEFLDKYALMCLYLNNLEDYRTDNEVEQVNPKMFDDGIKAELKQYITNNPYQKVPLYLALDRFIHDDLVEWNLICVQDYFDYFAKIEILNKWSDFLTGKTNLIDFTLQIITDKNETFEEVTKFDLNAEFIELFDEKNNIFTTSGRVRLNWNFFKNVVIYSKCLGVVDSDLQGRLDALNLMFSKGHVDDDLIDSMIPKVINLAKNSDNYILSKTYLYYIDQLIWQIYDKPIKDALKKGDYDNEYLNALAKLYSNNVDFIDFALDYFKKFSAPTKAVIILAMGKRIDLYKEHFIKLNETSKSLLPLTLKVYKDNPILVEELLPLLESKKLAERKQAFTLISTAYGSEYIAQIKVAFESENNAKLKDDMEIFILSTPD